MDILNTTLLSAALLKKKIKSKYLVFDSTDENKEVLKKCRELWNGIKNELKQ